MNKDVYREFLKELVKQYEQGTVTFEDLADTLWERENDKWSAGFKQGREDPDFENAAAEEELV